MYITIQGETWDEIAYKVYGSEKYADFLMASNYSFLDILIFSAGTILNTPDLPATSIDKLPPWRIEEDQEEMDPYDDYNGEDEQEW